MPIMCSESRRRAVWRSSRDCSTRLAGVLVELGIDTRAHIDARPCACRASSGGPKVLRRLLAAAILSLAALNCFAQYPSRALRLIVPFPPGGATDVLARVVADELSKRLGQPVVVNRPGAGANLGAQLAARAAPDGYTLLIAPTSIYAIAMTLYREPGYDLARDFAPVSLVANVPHVLVAHPSLGVHRVEELVALARAKRNGLSVASQGTGTVSHLEAEMLQHMAHIELLHVPYKGSAPAMVDLLAGRVHVMFDSIASALPQIKAGKLVALAVTTPARSPLLPAVPTVAESLLDYRAESMLGILVPLRTPFAVIERLNREVVAIINESKTRQAL